MHDRDRSTESQLTTWVQRGWDDRLEFWRRWHRHVLTCKGIADESALRAAIRHDLVVAVAAARAELDGIATDALLDEFFADHSDLREQASRASDESVVNHLGFQIHEPLDVWLEGLAHWAPRLGLEVVGTKRFTSSEAFRASVGSFAEMAQVWVRQDDTTVELEIFDIHRPNAPWSGPVEIVLSGASTRAMVDAAVPAVLRSALASDDIWHYGVHIVDEPSLERLHEQFLRLVDQDDRFRLRAQQTVANAWHGSVHSKLTNVELGIEVEFLTYQVDWAARSVQ